MKILFIDFALDKLGGVERVVSTLANELVQNYEVEICSIYRHSPRPFYKFDEKIQFNYLIDNSKLLSTKSNTKAGFYIFRVFEKIYEMISFTNKLRKFCETRFSEFDVVIFGRTTAAIIFMPYMKQYEGKVIVRDAIHLYDTTNKSKRLMKKYFPDKVDTLIVSSEESIQLYKEFFGMTNINIRKIYNPLGIIPAERQSEENKRIIGVGRYCRQKGFENLLYAYAQISKKYPEWTLALIGAGEDYLHYRRICKQLDITDRVEFYKSSNIVEEYSKADIFVMCSRNEGYANALVEAMACGVPSITYDWYVGADDIVEDGINGIIVRLEDRKKYFATNGITKNDADSLAKAINMLIENADLRNLLSSNARLICESRDRLKITDEWIKIIEERK